MLNCSYLSAFKSKLNKLRAFNSQSANASAFIVFNYQASCFLQLVEEDVLFQYEIVFG